MVRKALEQQARMEQEVVECTEPQHFSVATPKLLHRLGHVTYTTVAVSTSPPTCSPSSSLLALQRGGRRLRCWPSNAVDGVFVAGHWVGSGVLRHADVARSRAVGRFFGMLALDVWRRGRGGGGGRGLGRAGRGGWRLPGALLRSLRSCSDKFQQSFDWRCPRSSSLTVVGHSCYAAETCTHSANCADDRRDSPGDALGQVIDMPVVVQRHMHSPRGVKVVDIPVVAQMQIPTVLTVQKNIEILQLQSIEKVVDVTVGHVQQIPRVLSVRRQPRSHSCTRHFRSWTRSLTCPLCSTTYARRKLRRSRSYSALSRWPMSLLCRSSLFNSGGASDSVHRQSRGHLVVQQRPVRGVMAAVGGVFRL